MVTLVPCKSYCHFSFVDSEWQLLHSCRINM